MTGTDPYVPGHGDASYDVSHYDLDLAYKPEGNRLDAETTLRCVAVDDAHPAPAGPAPPPRRPGQRRRQGPGALHPPRRRPRGVAVPADPRRHRVRGAGEVLRPAGDPEVQDPRRRRVWRSSATASSSPPSRTARPPGSPATTGPTTRRPTTSRCHAPNGYHVAMSGEPVGTTARGSSVEWRYRQQAPMATYLATCQIGRYAVIEQDGPVPMRVVAPTDVAGRRLRRHVRAPAGDDAVLRERLRPLPVHLLHHRRSPTTTSRSRSSRSRCRRSGATSAPTTGTPIRLVAHELAHQWFGNAVTLRRWQDIWLHEGFACYAEWLWSEQSGSESADERARHHHDKLAGKHEDLVLADPVRS